MTDIAFVRSEITLAQPAPRSQTGAVAWMRKNLFASATDTVLTILAVLFLLWVIPALYGFLIGRAVPPGGTVEQCRVENVGACWAYIASEIEFFIGRRFPVLLNATASSTSAPTSSTRRVKSLIVQR